MSLKLLYRTYGGGINLKMQNFFILFKIKLRLEYCDIKTIELSFNQI